MLRKGCIEESLRRQRPQDQVWQAPTTRLLVGRWVEGGALTKGAGMGRGGDGICVRFRGTQTCGAPGRTPRGQWIVELRKSPKSRLFPQDSKETTHLISQCRAGA